MQPSEVCFDLIKRSEGCRLTAYKDTGGVWTIGYGHTRGVRPRSTITQQQAEAFLRVDVQEAVSCVNINGLPCTQGQFDALVDFVFNLGADQFLHSTLLRKHKKGDYAGAAKEFGRWVHDNGKVLPGLVKRREAERKLYVGIK